jgi:hypothetical protein
MGENWITAAQYREEWKRFWETYVEQWPQTAG